MAFAGSGPEKQPIGAVFPPLKWPTRNVRFGIYLVDIGGGDLKEHGGSQSSVRAADATSHLPVPLDSLSHPPKRCFGEQLSAGVIDSAQFSVADHSKTQ
jgi:hypothetical protein